LYAPYGQTLGTGDYLDARDYWLSATTGPGIDVWGSGWWGSGSCSSSLTGRFRIHEINFNSSGRVDRLAADFEQRCQGATGSLFGAIRYNSTRSSVMPFDGDALQKPTIAIGSPVNGSTVGRPFAINGWALNLATASGTGVDAIHVYAFPAGGGSPTFLGVAEYGAARPDVGAIFGTQFANSGFALVAGQNLAPGAYTVAVIARDTLTGTFNASNVASITIPAPVSQPIVTVESPANGGAVGGSFDVSGWAIDAGSESGPGIDAIHVYAFRNGNSTPIFLGVGQYGEDRPDVAAIYGDRFLASGFRLTVSGVDALTPGDYTLYVFARSTMSGQFHFTARAFTRVPGPEMALGLPGDGAHVNPSFLVAGWAIDRDAPSGAGVDLVNVWAFPIAGGSPSFIGATTANRARPDVAAIFGARFLTSGFDLTTTPLPPGTYVIAVCIRSTATGTFNQIKTLVVTID
jgi:hypothetical protein